MTIGNTANMPEANEPMLVLAVVTIATTTAAEMARAKLVLAQLEAQDRTSPAHRLIDDLPLFAAARSAAPLPERESALAAVVEALAALSPDEMTPREALEALYALKAQLARSPTTSGR